MIPVIKTKKFYTLIYMFAHAFVFHHVYFMHFVTGSFLPWLRFRKQVYRTWFLSPVKSIYNPVCTPNWLPYFTWPRNFEIINSSDAGNRIFQLRPLIPCLLMHWLLKSPEHQQAWYWLCRTDNMYCCSRVNFISLGQANPKIQFKIWIYLL